jgi:hypothetical protein
MSGLNELAPSRRLNRSVARQNIAELRTGNTMNRAILLLILLLVRASSSYPQVRVLRNAEPQMTGPSWNGFIKRGNVHVPAGGSVWTANGISVSHTEEDYPSEEDARFVLKRFKGKMQPGVQVSPEAGNIHFKVTIRKSSARIAWVCESVLHYIEADSYADGMEFLKSWRFGNSCFTHEIFFLDLSPSVELGRV